VTLYVLFPTKANKKLYIRIQHYYKNPFFRKTTLPKVLANQIFYN